MCGLGRGEGLRAGVPDETSADWGGGRKMKENWKIYEKKSPKKKKKGRKKKKKKKKSSGQPLLQHRIPV